MTDQPDSLRSAFIPPEDEGGTLGSALTTRHLEAFGRKVTSTASHLIAPNGDLQSAQYQAAVSSLHRELRRPATQRRIFAFSQTSPSELVRSKLSTAEIQTRALASLPDEMLADLPEDTSTYSLFQGFKASVPESDNEHRKSHRRRSTLKAIEGPNGKSLQQPASLDNLRDQRDTLHRRMEMMGVRKNMCSAEIKEIDNKVFNLQRMRDIVLDRLAGLEIEESDLEQDLYRLDSKIELEEELQGEQNDESATPKTSDTATDSEHRQQMDASFMSESVYGKLPSPESTKSLKQKPMRAKRTNPILHSHFEPGSRLREIPAHSDYITAIDFDVPFGTMVSAALDDTLRVWDLNSGRCTGFLEGHAASVRCIQVEENIVATGSMDASVRLWDLSQAKYLPRRERVNKQPPPEDEDGFEDLGATPPKYSLENCPLFSLEAHMDEVTAIHFQGDNLISGSADKTLRQWDLQTGRCVQTLDVLWAAAQADTFSSRSHWRPTGRLPDASADFVGALQCFESALACGTADGMIRLWDLRSGQVHRSLVGHTGPVTCLQFDSMHLVTGSADRSIRIWDLRTGAIYDAYAYDNAVTSMMFDQRRIVAAAGEDVVKVYDKTDGHRWDCGMGALDEKDREYSPSVVEKVRIRDGYLVEGRRDGVIGTWTC